SDLGKQFSAKGILDQLQSSKAINREQTKENTAGQQPADPLVKKGDRHTPQPENESAVKESSFQLIDQLLQSEHNNTPINNELRDDDKKRRRRSVNRDEEHEM